MAIVWPAALQLSHARGGRSCLIFMANFRVITIAATTRRIVARPYLTCCPRNIDGAGTNEPARRRVRRGCRYERRAHRLRPTAPSRRRWFRLLGLRPTERESFLRRRQEPRGCGGVQAWAAGAASAWVAEIPATTVARRCGGWWVMRRPAGCASVCSRPARRRGR
jgi:hypothetical protein